MCSGLGSLDWAPERQAFGGRQCPAEGDSTLVSLRSSPHSSKLFSCPEGRGWATPLRNSVRPECGLNIIDAQRGLGDAPGLCLMGPGGRQGEG